MDKKEVIEIMETCLFESTCITNRGIKLKKAKELLKDFIKNCYIPILQHYISFLNLVRNYGKTYKEFKQTIPFLQTKINLETIADTSDLFFETFKEILNELNIKIIDDVELSFCLQGYLIKFETDDNGNVNLKVRKSKKCK